MAPLPPNNTARLKLNYITPLGPQSTLIRVGDGADDATYFGFGQAMINTFLPLQTSQAVYTGVEFSAAGANFFRPLGTLNAAGTGAGNLIERDWPAYITFVGRDLATGRRARIFLSFPKATLLPDENYRDLSSEDPVVDSVVTQLNNNGLLSIAGSPVTWYRYVNLGFNAYRQRRRRRS